MSGKQLNVASLALVRQVAGVVVGSQPEVQSAALAELMCIYLRGHHVPGDKAVQTQVRQRLFRTWCKLVADLMELYEENRGDDPMTDDLLRWKSPQIKPHPIESNTQSGSMPKNYEVVFEIKVQAKTPEQAATLARDVLLNPDSMLHAEVHRITYCEEADDWFPDRDHGWSVHFGGLKYHWAQDRSFRCWIERIYSVTPDDCIEWSREKQ